MKLDGNKKFVLLGLILLIVAGIIVVVLKGFNLPVTYQKHEAINFKVGNNIDMEKLNNICKEVRISLQSLTNEWDTRDINIPVDDSQTYKRNNYYTIYNEVVNF